MSYCRFENTVGDLIDCEENLDRLDIQPGKDGALSESERKYAIRLIKVCVRIADNYRDAEPRS